MKYLITESQFKTILEQTSDVRMKFLIREYILSNFEHVVDVKFKTKNVEIPSTEGEQTIEKTIIIVVIERSNVHWSDLANIENSLITMFDLKLRKPSSKWGLIIRKK
jgi:hypothetical protein